MRSLLLIIFSLSISFKCVAQIEGTKFKDALISKNADLHYIFSDAPGFSVMKNGRMMGICVDIMKDFEFFLLDKYGIRVNSVLHNEYLYDFPEFFHLIENSKYGVFGLSNITRTLKREENFQFSPPFIKNYAVMLSHKNIPDLPLIDSISQSFEGLKAVTVVGSTNMMQIENIKEEYYPTLQIDCVKSFKEVVEVISRDQSYFTIIDLAYWLQAKNDDLPLREHTAGVQVAEEMAVMMPFETDWNIPLRKFLTDGYTNSPSYRKIITRHLGWETLTWLDEMKTMESMFTD